MENNWITPEKVQEDLSIEKSQYYLKLKELGIKAHKYKGRAYLDEDQVQRLKDHLSGGQSVIATVDSGEMILPNAEEEISDDEADDLYWEAAELAANRLKLRNLIKLNLASKIDYAKLPPELQEDVRLTAEAANLNVGKLASGLATKIYEKHQ